MAMIGEWQAALDALATRDRLRSLALPHGIDFASNDYLGLAGSPRLRAALTDALAKGVPVGSGGSRLLRGHGEAHAALEEQAARFFGSETALYCATGFAANGAILASLPSEGDLVVHDALIHASAHDGMRLGRAERVSVPHNDAGAFEDAIAAWRTRGGTGRPWIAVESLYSMDGDRAPLADLAAIADRHEAVLLIDEAHATGVFGPGGRGLAHALDGRDNVITLHTCGKALGVEGALICAPAPARDLIVNRGRSFIFSTAPSPLMACAVAEALRICADEPERRARLMALIDHAGAALAPHGATPTGSPILPLILGEDARTMAVAARLRQAGFDVRGIRPPSVLPSTARLRIAITCNIDSGAIDALAMALEEALA